MTAVPNLYLKWRAFRALFPDAKADAAFAKFLLPNEEEELRASKFSKLLTGDATLRPENAKEIVGTINDYVARFRKDHGLPVRAETAVSPQDLFAPLFHFLNRMIGAAEKLDDDALDRLHAVVLNTLSPWRNANPPPRLLVERCERFGWVESDATAEFEVGELGRFSVADTQSEPASAYVYAIRDPSLHGHRFWEASWGKTVLWLPSPFRPVRQHDRLALTEPEEVKPLPGRFIVTAVLLLDPALQTQLDPRNSLIKGGLDETQTSRFLTTLRRLKKAHPKSIEIAANEYVVKT